MGKKRTEMTSEELEYVRKKDREKQQRRRMKLSKDEKEEIKINNTKGRAEARKKLRSAVQQRTSVPLQPVEKRRLVSNFMHAML